MMTRRQLLVGGAAAFAATAIGRSAWAATPAASSASAVAPAVTSAVAPSPLDAIVGECPGIVALRDSIRTIVDQTASLSRRPFILVVGETGAGKDLVAQVLHRAGPRSDGPYMVTSLTSMPSELLESELFGYVPGGFNIPPEKTSGWELAQGGTLVLEGIEFASSQLWPKIIRTLQTQSVRRIGATRAQPVDAWTIATSHWPLECSVGDRTLGDWLAPLDPVVLTIPRLRDRGDDIQLLADHFLAKHCCTHEKPQKFLTPAARQALAAEGWPGNVRHLANVMEMAVIHGEHQEIDAADVDENTWFPQANPVRRAARRRGETRRAGRALPRQRKRSASPPLG